MSNVSAFLLGAELAGIYVNNAMQLHLVVLRSTVHCTDELSKLNTLWLGETTKVLENISHITCILSEVPEEYEKGDFDGQ